MKQKNGFIYYFSGICPYNIGDTLESPVMDQLGRRFSFTKKAVVSKIHDHVPYSKLMGEVYVEFY